MIHKSAVPRAGLQPVIESATVATVGLLPLLILSAVAALIRSDLGFTEAQLGLAASIFFAAVASCSVPAGWMVERLGDRRSLVIATLASAIALLGMATAWSWTVLLVWLAVGGMVNSISQLGANLQLAGAVSPSRQGLAFGVKQSAMPAASLVGGLALPLIAVPLGWRWVFAAAAVLAILVGAVLVRGQQKARPGWASSFSRPTFNRGPVIVLGVAAAFGSAAAVAMTAFLVSYAVSVGVRPGLAGVALAIGSVGAVISRVVSGWLADRRQGGNLMVVVLMLVAGAAAVASLSLVSTWVPLVLVTLLAYSVGWGWPGLFHFTIVRGNPQAPAAAGGITQVGTSLGGVIGPLTFGLIVSDFGYPVAWWSAASWLMTAAVLMLLGRRFAQRASVRDRTAPEITGPSRLGFL